MKDRQQAVIVGGGVIGCAIAYELAKKGIHPVVVDKGPLMGEATPAAAGMLGAYVETHHPGPSFEFGKFSLGMYRAWAEELLETAGVDVQYVDQGIIRAALTEADENELRGRLKWLGGEVQWLSPAEIREMEPAAGKTILGGLYFPGDHHVQPPLLAKALEAALRKMGCTLMPGNPVLRLIHEGEKIAGVVTAGGEVRGDVTIIAAGAWSSALLQPLGLQLPVFPVKGQCYAVRPHYPLIKHTLFTHGCYLVPKRDGSVIVGATQEQIGFDKTPTAAAIAALHETAQKLLPGIEKAEWVSTWTGLRPGSEDGMPYLGWVPGAEKLAIAAGHYRNGILLAPATGKLMAELIAGTPLSFDVSPFAVQRVVTA